VALEEKAELGALYAEAEAEAADLRDAKADLMQQAGIQMDRQTRDAKAELAQQARVRVAWPPRPPRANRQTD
jgi:hypothetical protein